jgi:hypothetical protein
MSLPTEITTASIVEFRNGPLYLRVLWSNLERFSDTCKAKIEKSEYNKTSAGLETTAFSLMPQFPGILGGKSRDLWN